MLLLLAGILVVLWILGLIAHILVGGFIHALIVIAVVLFIWHFISGRRHTV